MAKIAHKPFMLVDVLLKISAPAGAEIGDYEAHVSKVQFDPSATTATWKGMTPGAEHTFAGRATWVCGLDFAQDWETANSLSRYIHDHELERIDVTFEPVAGGAGFESTLTITAGSIGGAGEAVATSSVSFPSTRPEYIPAA
jgi:hypothetical protein